MTRLELQIAWRYLRSRRGSKLLSLISIIAIGGVLVAGGVELDVTGGGAEVTLSGASTSRVAYLTDSHPASTTSWTGEGRIGATALSSGNTATITVYAICA